MKKYLPSIKKAVLPEDISSEVEKLAATEEVFRTWSRN